MTNILTISPYKEFSSIGERSFNFISVLDSVDSVNTFNVHYSMEENVNEKINIPFDKKDLDIDICAMYLTPEHFVKTKYYALGVFEPSTAGDHSQKTYTEYLDSLVVYSNKQKDACKNLNKNINVLKPSINLKGVLNPMKSIDRVLRFYIPSIEKTANVDLVVKAYFKTFSASDNVALGVLSQNPHKDIERFNNIKRECSSGPDEEYPEIILFTDIKEIHKECHCCIDVDSTYKISLGPLIALRFGNPIICLETSSIQEWLPDDVCYKVKSYEDFVIDSGRSFIYRNEVWQLFSMTEISNTMRSIYEERSNFRNKQHKIITEYHSFFDPANSTSTVEQAICF
mgnify:FL=1